MTREDKDSLVEMLAKIPITETRGSLLSAIGRLLRVIDISESSIMIPTLLKDKCEFDAYEMLTLAKILKASILGHNDLVEFYMSESSSQVNTIAMNTLTLPLSITNSTSSTTPTTTSSSSPSTTSQLLQQQQLLNRQQQFQHNKQIISHHYHQNHQNQLQLQSTSPSLRSSLSESTSSTSPSTTPQPRAETINGSSQLQLNNNGDPDATIRLLLQIEQLKTFIPQVTGIFESIIELYKNSVDTIT